jgi:hypothetical protein
LAGSRTLTHVVRRGMVLWYWRRRRGRRAMLPTAEPAEAGAVPAAGGAEHRGQDGVGHRARARHLPPRPAPHRPKSSLMSMSKRIKTSPDHNISAA